MTRSKNSPARDLIFDLRLSDEKTGGKPVLAPEQVVPARDFLERLLLRPSEMQQHFLLLNECYKGEFTPPLPRRLRGGMTLPLPPGATAHFLHAEPLPEPLALAILEGGVDRLPADELARLLLNPLGLWDLADLVYTTLPDYWLDRMQERGAELAREEGIDLMEGFEEVVGSQPEGAEGRLEAALAPRKNGPGTPPTVTESGAVLNVPEPARSRIARAAYGDANAAFTLTLYRVRRDGGRFAAQLAIAPAPTAGDVTVPVRFRTGDEMSFVMEVPPESKVDPTLTRSEMRSDISPPLPAEVVVTAEYEWRGEGDWPRLVFRSGQGGWGEIAAVDRRREAARVLMLTDESRTGEGHDGRGHARRDRAIDARAGRPRQSHLPLLGSGWDGAHPI
jgi:hypothetical protein